MPKFRVEFSRTEVAYGTVTAPDEETLRKAAEHEVSSGELNHWWFEDKLTDIIIRRLPDDATSDTGITAAGVLCHVDELDCVEEED